MFALLVEFTAAPCCSDKASEQCSDDNAVKAATIAPPAVKKCCAATKKLQEKQQQLGDAEKGETNTCKSKETPSACCPGESTKQVCFDKRPLESTKCQSTCEKKVTFASENISCCEPKKETPCAKNSATKCGSTSKSGSTSKCGSTVAGDVESKDKSNLLSNMGNKVTYGSFKGCSDDSQYTSVPCDSIDAQVDDEVEILPVVNVVTTTKLRIQNICCGKEAELMKRELEPLDGIEAVSVNVVGRIGFVKHNMGVITASEIVTILNDLHLGVSIMESGHHDGNEALNKEYKIRLGIKLGVLSVLLGLFITVIVGRVYKAEWRKWVAIAEIVIGGLPILRKAVMNWMKKIFIDINVLMLLAVIGTVALNEWIEGATVVFVFAIAEVLQDYCTYRVQRAISGLPYLFFIC